MTDEEISYLNVCTECEAGNELALGEPHKEAIKNGERSASTIQLTELQTMKGEIPTIQQCTVEQTKEEFCRKPTMEVGVS